VAGGLGHGVRCSRSMSTATAAKKQRLIEQNDGACPGRKNGLGQRFISADKADGRMPRIVVSAAVLQASRSWPSGISRSEIVGVPGPTVTPNSRPRSAQSQIASRWRR
jgi:hypothetical protein